MRAMHRLWPCSLLAGAALFALWATPLAAQQPAAANAGREALQKAASIAEKITGLRGPERIEVLEQAARAYEETALAFAAERGVAAQAHWEAGELWRRRGDLALAEPHYMKANELDPGRFAERALLELGHCQRRGQRVDEAIETYQKVCALKPASARAHEARLWIGRSWQQKGSTTEAVTAFRAALEAASTPGRVVETCDWLAKALLKQGDLAGAEAAIQHAEQQKAGGDEAEQLQKAIAGMSARKAVQRFKDKQNGVDNDAEDVDEHEQEETGKNKRETPKKRE